MRGKGHGGSGAARRRRPGTARPARRAAHPGSERFLSYARLTTESLNPKSARLDRMATRDLLLLMNAEDAGVARAVRRVLPAVEALVARVEASFRGGGRLIYAGAGTSGRLGVLDAAECPPTFGTPPGLVRGVIAGGMRALVRSVEGAEDDAAAGARAMTRHRVGPRDVVVGIAASGMTPFVRGALLAAVRRGAVTALITCSPESEPGAAPIVICPVVGPEVIMGSTRLKAGTATKMVLNMITTAAMVRMGKVYRNMMVDLQRKSRKLDERARRVVMLAGDVGYDRAGLLLERAGGEVKTAVVMARRRVGAPRARRLLAENGGHVWRVLGEK